MLADDTTLQTSNKSQTEVESALQDSLDNAASWCRDNHMALNPTKSKSMLITTRQKHQRAPLKLNLTLNNEPLHQVSEHKHLGVVIDDKLRWNAHVDHVCKIISRNVYLLSKLQSIITLEARKLFFNAHIQPHFDYASIIWDGISDALFKRLNSLHRRAVKLIIQDQSLTTDEKLQEMNILPLDKHFFLTKATYMFKIINDKSPNYLQQLFKFSSSQYSSHRRNLAFPKPRVDIYKTSLSYDGVAVWNSLPVPLRNLSTVTAFKRHLHSFITDTIYP
jgi:hypothetical protein